ncbi:MAG: pyrimidine/purine nucleoside phosphorylase [Chthoniobacterales bacterium]|nr:pyrimidine/purine nucleoside phosphorylase [Chthoniobacterales bacterium]
MEFPNVTAIAKANIYFEGRVVSHAIIFPDGSKRTLGLMYPGTYHFATAVAERMQIIEGQCAIVLEGEEMSHTFQAGEEFRVPGNSGFTVTVADRICQYVCSFLS